MHTFSGKSVTIHHNSDMSGEAFIRVRTPGTVDDETEIRVDARDLLEFVARHVARERIAVLEQATADEILGL